MSAVNIYVSSLWLAFSPKGISQLSGPVGITKIGSEAASKGIDDYLVYLWIMSLVLGVMNLIPFIPVLDGGQIVFALYKVITGREVGATVRLVASVVGVVTILCLFVIGLYNDISRLILHR